MKERPRGVPLDLYSKKGRAPNDVRVHLLCCVPGNQLCLIPEKQDGQSPWLQVKVLRCVCVIFKIFLL